MIQMYNTYRDLMFVNQHRD